MLLSVDAHVDQIVRWAMGILVARWASIALMLELGNVPDCRGALIALMFVLDISHDCRGRFKYPYILPGFRGRRGTVRKSRRCQKATRTRQS